MPPRAGLGFFDGHTARMLPSGAAATRNRAGLWVVGKSKSSQAGTSQADGGAKARISPWANKTLHEFYAPWQRRLRRLLERTNASLLPLEERLLG